MWRREKISLSGSRQTSLLFFLDFCIFRCLDILPASIVGAPHSYSAGRGQKKALDPMELKLQMIVSYCVGIVGYLSEKIAKTWI